MGVRDDVGFIAPVEGLRGVAVLWVIAFHSVAVRAAAGDPWIDALASVPPLDALARNGHLGVDLFFLISGFLLTLPWVVRARDGRPAPSARAFYARRFWRIAPAYYLQLFVLFAVALPLLRGVDYWRGDLYVLAWNGIAHAGFLHNTSPLTSGSMGVNGALWTLAVEAQFYMLVPLAAPLFVRAPLASTAAAFALSAAWRAGAQHGFDGPVQAFLAAGAHWGWSEAVVRQLLLTQLPAYLGHFALGALLGAAWLRRSHGGDAAAAMAAGAAAVLLLLFGTGGAWLGESTWLLTTALLGAVLYGCASSTTADRILGRGVLAIAGRISYSAYLYHLPLLALWMHFAPPLPAGAHLPAYLAGVAAVAWLSWRGIEVRWRRGVPWRAGPVPFAGTLPVRPSMARARADGQGRHDGEGLQ